MSKKHVVKVEPHHIAHNWENAGKKDFDFMILTESLQSKIKFDKLVLSVKIPHKRKRCLVTVSVNVVPNPTRIGLFYFYFIKPTNLNKFLNAFPHLTPKQDYQRINYGKS